MDYGIAVKGGTDGNAYIVGYSEKSQAGPLFMKVRYRVPILLVVSPTGRVILRHEMTSNGDVSQTVRDMELVEAQGSSRTILFIGETNDPKSPTSSPRVFLSGLQILQGIVAPFEGFKNVFAPLDFTPSGQNKSPQGSSARFWFVPLVGALGGVVVLAGVATAFVLGRRENEDVSNNNSGIATGKPMAKAELQ